jgi:hypothetical protein
LEKYFRHLTFYSRYDEEIEADKSILHIPALSIVLPVAWITGSDVYIDELDQSFAESMDSLQQEYKKMYPRAPFKTRLIAESLVENKPSPEGVALLFSGGVDSTYSLFSNLHLNPRLVMIFGVWDLPLKNVKILDRIKRVYPDFAEQEGFKLHFIHTNALEVLDIDRVEHFFWRFDHGRARGFWNGLGFSLGHIGQVAPLSMGRFNHIITSGTTQGKKEDSLIQARPYASIPSTDEKIKWANLKVNHHGGINRHEKIYFLKKYLKQNRITLRVCGQKEQLFKINSLNCGRCEKCLRTITALILMDIDPNKYGFKVDDSTFKLLRTRIEEKQFSERQLKIWWKTLQQIIPEELERDFYGSKKFFEWFKNLVIDPTIKPDNNPVSILYYKLPYPISNTLRKIFYD